jgi:hypothetical protein
LRNQILPSAKVKERTWSMNGFDLRDLCYQTKGRTNLGGTPKTWIIISFMRREEGVSSKDLSKDRIGREPFRQFPDRLSSSLQ